MDAINNLHTYCRFCAESKAPADVLNLSESEERYNVTLTKLAFVNAIYVDLNPENMLPKTVCFACYDSLNTAYEFLYNVKKAQDLLLTLYDSENRKKHVNKDERLSILEGNFSSVTVEDVLDIKQEIHIDKVKQEIKIEPTDEAGTRDESYDPTINVQDMLYVPIQSTPIPTDGTLCTNEKSDLNKEFESWKEYPWICAYCNLEFFNLEFFCKHSKAVHGQSPTFVCVDCKYDRMVFETLNNFIEHMQTHGKRFRTTCNHKTADYPGQPITCLTDLPLPSRSNVLTGAQVAAASTSVRVFTEPLTITAPKSKARRQREYRQRMAATRTLEQAIAARKLNAERQRICRLRKAAGSTLVTGPLESTTASSSRSGARSNNVQTGT